MVEAVVVIPVLLVLWLSLYYAGGLFLARQEADVTARSCAWLYSANDCEEVPAGCGEFLVDSHAASVAPEVSDTLPHGAQTAMNGGDAEDIIGSIFSELVATPFLAAFTSSVDAKVDQPVQQPALYGGGMKVVSGRYHLACNLRRDTPEAMAKRAWSTLVPF